MKLKATAILATILSLFVITSTAEAKRYHSHSGYHATSQRAHSRTHHYTQRTLRSTHRVASFGGRHAAGPRPGKWCGWYMRTQLGGGPAFNLAANWRRYGRASGPQVGAVVVWPHHVGMITGRSSNGQWIVKSGNDGHAVRERPRSVAGAQFRI